MSNPYADFALENPFLGGLESLVPVALAALVPGGARNVLLGAGLGAGGVAWYLWRNSQREELVSAINNDTKIFGIRAFFTGSKLPLPPNQAWLTQADGPEKKAAELILYTNATTAAQALEEVKASLPAIPPASSPASTPGALAQLLAQGVSVFEEATGIKVPPSVQSEAEKYTKTEQAESADTIAAQGQELWDWLSSVAGGETKKNPSLGWDEYLSGLDAVY